MDRQRPASYEEQLFAKHHGNIPQMNDEYGFTDILFHA